MTSLPGLSRIALQSTKNDNDTGSFIYKFCALQKPLLAPPLQHFFIYFITTLSRKTKVDIMERKYLKMKINTTNIYSLSSEQVKKIRALNTAFANN